MPQFHPVRWKAPLMRGARRGCWSAFHNPTRDISTRGLP